MRKVHSRSKPLREGIAYLLEDVMQKSAVVMAAQGIIDNLQDMAEKLSTVEAKDIMPMSDSLTNAFGPTVAEQFNSVATEQVRVLITAVQSAKTAIDGEIQRMKRGLEGGDMSDLASDQEPDLDAAPGPPEVPGLPEVPTGRDMDDGGEIGGFAGRERKESASPRGKSLDEDFLNAAPAPAPEISQHPHKSSNFAPNISNLGAFHGNAGKMAKNIEAMIDNDPLKGEERKALANVLSHFAAFAKEPAHWADAEAKLTSCLQQANLWDVSGPAVAKIVTQLKKLAHLIAFKHEGMIENAIRQLRHSTDPDGLVFHTFRRALAETRDAQTAAIRTARTFAIDVEDVVGVVKEAAKKECPACKGTGTKGKGKAAKKCSECKGSGKVSAIKETRKVNEVDMLQGASMFPVQVAPTAAATPNPPLSNPGAAGTSTAVTSQGGTKPVPPQSPAMKRAVQPTQQTINTPPQNGNVAPVQPQPMTSTTPNANTQPQPNVNNTQLMSTGAPPQQQQNGAAPANGNQNPNANQNPRDVTDTDQAGKVPYSAQTKMAPTNNVGRPNQVKQKFAVQQSQ